MPTLQGKAPNQKLITLTRQPPETLGEQKQEQGGLSHQIRCWI